MIPATINGAANGVWSRRIGEPVAVTGYAANRMSVYVVDCHGAEAQIPATWVTKEKEGQE